MVLLSSAEGLVLEVVITGGVSLLVEPVHIQLSLINA